MKEYQIGKNDAGQRLDRFISKAVPLLPTSLAQKYIRLKRFKIDGKSAKRDYVLNQGDVLQMYINDEYFEETRNNVLYNKNVQSQRILSEPDILYEDDNIMLINKPAGVLCHSDKDSDKDSLISQVLAYLYQGGKWNPENEHSFRPALCNRIDRNTSGIVIVSKNAQSLRLLNEKIRKREIDKYYMALVLGEPGEPAGRLFGYHEKDSVANRVTISQQSNEKTKEAIMEYKTLATTGNLSLLECLLFTGRTHQIRAQLAEIGTPILGDNKYGDKSMNKQFGEKFQALCSYKLVLSFKSDAGIMQYLNKKEFLCENIPFLDKYFPDYSKLI
ncbi:MAG: RluA family pseudouridine synthase [Oscillospiraceae bacterium]|nr:RluA family pseudouridine synthase [Oscillospiraceae bacterium]